MDSHTATVNSGTYEDDIGTTTLKAICNDNEGFSIYAIGYTGETYGTTTLVGVSTGQTIATGTATSGNTSNWAMKLETNSSATYPITLQNGYGSYSNVPTTYTKVAERQSATDTGTSAIGSVLTTTYATYVSSTQVADTYNGKVKYTLVHPYDAGAPVIPLAEEDCPANSVCYAPNSGDIVGTMVSGTVNGADLKSISANAQAGRQTYTTYSNSSGGSASANITSNAPATLIAPNYSRSGYGFAGWSTDFNATSSSTIYGPNEQITVGDVSTNGMILYPVWVKSVGNLQDSSKVATLCGQGTGSLTQANYNSTTGKVEATLSSVTALTDQRDGNTYAIAKLPDGNCWIIENLRLDAENSSNSSLAQGFGGAFEGLADSENANFTTNNGASDPTTANSKYYAGTQEGTATVDISQTNYAGLRMPRYNNNNINRTLGASQYKNGSTTYYHWYSYGNYYTWASAMANTSYYNNTITDVNGFTPSEAANTSLCPTGWRLPYGRSTGKGATVGGFSYLDIQLGGTGASQSSIAGATQSNLWRSFPNNFIYSGYFRTASVLSRGSYGYYWSSTASDAYYSYSMSLYSTTLSLSTDAKYNGLSIRCVAGN